jgi:hypothetical protein
VLPSTCTHGADIERQGHALIEVFGELLPPPAPADAALDRAPLAAAREHLTREFDGRFGGFGQAPKFPHPMNLEFLLRSLRASADGEEPDLQALYMATLTLTRMAEGGIYDQLGGGFCRYSVDPYWMIPHFEKMLYDNGQLLAVAAQAALATADPLFLRVTDETADWLRRDMEQPGGGFYATLDADSEGHEGRFYVWNRDELQSLLPQDEYAAFAARFGIDRSPNFEGKWHLHCFKSMTQVAEELRVAEDTAAGLIDRARARLLPVRNRRVWPGRDEKVLTSWNGLAIAGLAAAARSLRRPELADSAARAADFLREHCWYQGRLLAVHKDGRSRFPAYLDDHAVLAWGLLELTQARWHAPHFAWAIELTEAMLTHFEDREAGGFFHRRRPRRAHSTPQDVRRRRDPIRERRRGTTAGPTRISARRAALSGRGRANTACCVAGAREVPAWPHDARHGARRADCAARRGRAAWRARGARGLAVRARPSLRPASARTRHTDGRRWSARRARRQAARKRAARVRMPGPAVRRTGAVAVSVDRGAARTPEYGGWFISSAISAPMARRLPLRPEFDRPCTTTTSGTPSLRARPRAPPFPAPSSRARQVIAVCVCDDVSCSRSRGDASLSDSIEPDNRDRAQHRAPADRARSGRDARRGGRSVDAAVMGGAHHASGEPARWWRRPADLARVRPVLAATCRIVHAGPLGAGMVLKAANNLVTMLQLVARLACLARAGGLDLACSAR